VPARGDLAEWSHAQRQCRPKESGGRVGRWPRAIKTIFETATREARRAGESHTHPNPGLAALAILGMANSVPSWYAKEKASIERIGSEFSALVLEGVMVRTSPRRRRG